MSCRLIGQLYSLDILLIIRNNIIYIYSGQNWKLSCKREIILSGGVIGSAQILLLSGVGPAEDLEKLNVGFSLLSR